MSRRFAFRHILFGATLIAVGPIGCGGEDPAMMTPMGTGTTAAQLLEDCGGTFDVSDVDARATMRVDGRRLIIRGVYMDGTTAEILAMLDANPNVRTIVLANMGGSDVSMDGNLVGGREVRRRGLGTCVPANGLVASGGSDFLLSGAQRAVLPGGRVGVHSWAGDDGNGNTVEGRDVPRGDPQHQTFLDYYRDIGIDENFYWFTLERAPANGMHYMSRAEMVQFNVFTTE